MRRSLASKSSKSLSIGFSGAGFMGSYHVGVAACLIQHGVIPHPDDNTLKSKRIKLTGVSAGAIISSAVIAGVNMEEAMSVVLEAGRIVRKKCGILDVLTPGFSLVDEIENLMIPIMNQALNEGDVDLLQKRLAGETGSRLRIGFTDVPSMTQCLRSGRAVDLKEKGYRYLEEFRTIDDVISSSVISSYIPGGTGPMTVPSLSDKNSAVPRSLLLVKEMFTKIHDFGGEYAYTDRFEPKSSQINLIDGGLVNMWPTVNNSTIIVSPLSGSFDPNPCICPPSQVLTDENIGEPSSPWPWQINWKFKDPCSTYEVYVTKENTETLRRMILSSTDEILETRFRNGWDDAR
jgi:hypothetical protein